MLFGRKSRGQAAPLATSTGFLTGIPDPVPLVGVAGAVPPGSEGNSVVAAAFDQMSQAVDIQRSGRRLLVYDMTDLRYEFGDHLGAFFWNLPALLDGVAIMVAATGDTRRNLASLQRFIGPWLPIGFYDSVAAISALVRDGSGPVEVLSRKREACSQQGRAFPPGETGVQVVGLGSRQTGKQYRTGQRCRNDSDLDLGVVGGPRELALLTAKLRDQPDLMPDVGHPPIRGYASAEEAVAEGLLVFSPRPR
jgi:hypothetical protein